jgi:hypothetical protein
MTELEQRARSGQAMSGVSSHRPGGMIWSESGLEAMLGVARRLVQPGGVGWL